MLESQTDGKSRFAGQRPPADRPTVLTRVRRRCARAFRAPATNPKVFAIKSAFACGWCRCGFEISMNSSIFANATASPLIYEHDRVCAVQHRAASHDFAAVQERNKIISRRLSSFGWPLTSATICQRCLAVACVCRDCLEPLATSPRLSSVTTRIPDLSDSSRIIECLEPLVVPHISGDGFERLVC